MAHGNSCVPLCTQVCTSFHIHIVVISTSYEEENHIGSHSYLWCIRSCSEIPVIGT